MLTAARRARARRPARASLGATWYHPRVSEPVLAPAEPRAQFRCCPRCGAVLTSPGRVRWSVRPAASRTTSTPPSPRRRSCCAATGRGCSSAAATSPASAAWRSSAASSTRGRRPRRRCAARCARRSASSWTRSATSARSPTPTPIAASPTTWSISSSSRGSPRASAPRAIDGVEAIEWHDPLALDPARLAFASMTWALATFQRQRT